MIRVGRIAGQYAKPRSKPHEQVGEQTLPVYRGDMVNGREAHAEQRRADPQRIDLALNSGNYDLSYQGNNLTITKALLNVIADAKTKVYGDADPALTYQVSGLKNQPNCLTIIERWNHLIPSRTQK